MDTCSPFLSYHMFLHFTIYIISFPISFASQNTVALTGYKFNLIHRDSFLPSSLLPHGTSDFRTGMWADTRHLLFMVNISIGVPPTTQLIAMDLGSPLLWVECDPCTNCTTPDIYRYNREKSSSYSGIECTDRSCNDLDDPDCDILSGQCTYILRYTDRTIVKGKLATEKLTFLTSNYDIDVREIMFGCTTEHRSGEGLYPLSGIMGINHSPLSLIQQLNVTRFSYCTANVKDPLYSQNQLALGVSAVLEGNSTQLYFFRDNYHVKLEGISVGDKRLNIDFETTYDKGQAMLDTGSTLTFIVGEAFIEIIREVDRLVKNLDNPIGRSFVHPGSLCYRGDMYRDIDQFPRITFHLQGGANLKLDVDSIFDQVSDNSFCLTIDASPRNVIGMMAQQNHNMGYDLAARQLSIRMVDCGDLNN